MKTYLLIIGLILAAVAGCTAGNVSGQSSNLDAAALENQQQAPPLSKVNWKNLGEAPELSNTVWLNTDETLRLADLRGKVVLLEMWTFGCYNCRNVIPNLKAWHQTYAEDGLVIIGNHYPEFTYEEDLENVKDAVAELGIEYPVAIDNDGQTWRAYNNRYWPTLYLIDKNGEIRYTHIGEGAYLETEEAIRQLLAE